MTLELQVFVTEAKDIPKMDFFGKADPYVILQLIPGDKKERTATRQQTFDPVWRQNFRFPITNMQTQVLQLQLMDADEIGADDAISTLDIPLTSLTPYEIKDEWYDPIPVKGVKKGGKLHLKLQIATAGRPFFQPYQPADFPPPNQQPPPEKGPDCLPQPPAGYLPQGDIRPPPFGYGQGHPPQPPGGYQAPQMGISPQGGYNQGHPPQPPGGYQQRGLAPHASQGQIPQQVGYGQGYPQQPGYAWPGQAQLGSPHMAPRAASQRQLGPPAYLGQGPPPYAYPGQGPLPYTGPGSQQYPPR
jgi:hypothetical protein